MLILYIDNSKATITGKRKQLFRNAYLKDSNLKFKK